MRRVAGILCGLVLLGGFVLLAGGASDSPSGKTFKVELDNAFGLIEGGDFKIAGVRAGKIKTLEVDPKTKRAIVSFEINSDGFGALRTDAKCDVMPQSLVGEYYVDCEPGRKGRAMKAGDTIPVERTSSTVPPDLVNNIMRRPYRERLTYVLNELGAAVAGNADNLNAALRRASPALRETNKVLKLLADQNQVLADLATNADRVVGELSANRRDVSRWVIESRDLATTSAARDREIAAGFRRLPTFLRELRPTMAELGRTVDAQGPALQNLSRSAGQLERLFKNLPPFARANRVGLDALGEAGKIGSQAIPPIRPTIAELNRYSRGVPELGGNLARVLEHLDDRDHAVEDDPRSPGGKGYTGLEALLQYVFDQTIAINIHDGTSHILKTLPFEGECAPYADIEAAREFGERCSTALGPNQIGINFPDRTAPPGYDGRDRGGPQEQVQQLPVPIPLPRRRASARAEDEAAQRDAAGADAGAARRGAASASRTPRPDEVVPSTPKASEVQTPKAAQPQVTREAQDSLLDFLLGS